MAPTPRDPSSRPYPEGPRWSSWLATTGSSAHREAAGTTNRSEPQEQPSEGRRVPDVAGPCAKGGDGRLGREVAHRGLGPSPQQHDRDSEQEGDGVQGEDDSRTQARHQDAGDRGADRPREVLVDAAERDGRRQVRARNELGEDGRPRRRGEAEPAPSRNVSVSSSAGRMMPANVAAASSPATAVRKRCTYMR